MASRIDSLGIRARVRLLIMVPLLTLVLVMCAYTASTRLSDLERMQLALASEAPFTRDDFDGASGGIMAEAPLPAANAGEQGYAHAATAGRPAIDHVDSALSPGPLLRRAEIIRDVILFAFGAALFALFAALWLGRRLIVTPFLRLEKSVSDAPARERGGRHEGHRRESADSEGKVDFLANMSHELRTPINAVIGYTALMEKAGLSPEQHEYARIINCASTQLLRMIDDILSFSRLESGVVQLDETDFDLREVLEDALCMMAPEARDKCLELVLIIDPRVPCGLVGDSARVGQVFINLIGNAVKFSERGDIVVHVLPISTHGGCANIEVRVEDRGIGIAPEAIDRIFTAFHQADASISRHYGGTGLGLSIASRLVKLWDGHIGVASVPGTGSTFWFTLRCGLQSAPPRGPAPAAFAGRKALVYDDNPAAQRAVHNLLLGWSMDIVPAHKQASIAGMLQAACDAGSPFDLVVLGLRLARDEHGTYQSGDLVDTVRRRHALPLLLMVNCRYTELLSRSLHDSGIRIVVKPMRSAIVYSDLCALLGLVEAGGALVGNAPAAEFAGLSVLVAEDNDFNIGLLTRVLEGGGVSVVQARNGETAVVLARTRRFDIVIMDLHLPGMDGVETARRLRALGMGQIPIIALTADVFALENPSTEMDDCLLKPLDERELWRAIGRLRRGRADRPPPREGAMSVAAITRRMRPRLVSSIALQRRRLAEALAREDAESLRELIHELKGLSGYFGLKGLTAAVAEFEDLLIESGDMEACRRQFVLIDSLIAQLEAGGSDSPPS